jgi:hypothetical protein
VVSAGGVGFDISCGVRALHTGLQGADVLALQKELATALYHRIPAGVGRTGSILLGSTEMQAMLRGGARWAIERGWGIAEDLERIEERGCMEGAEPGEVSERAMQRQRGEMGTLGSGNHYLEVQEVTAIFDEAIAKAFGRPRGARQSLAAIQRAATVPIHRILGTLRGTAGGTDFGWPTMIGATGRLASPSPSVVLPSWVASHDCANPIQHVPSPSAQAASIRFCAARAQFSTLQGPCEALAITMSAGAP